MQKRKICVVVTARPSYSRIRTALRAIQNHSQLELQLVVAASSLLDKYGKVVKQIEADGFEVTAKVYNLIEGETLVTSAKTTGLGIIELATVFENIKPDIVVTIADRYETMATAIASSYMNIPLAHIQGGEVTGNIDEKVRHAITKLSDYHFVASKKAGERVLKMGEDKSSVFVTGCPSIDIAKEVEESSSSTYFDPVSSYGGVGNLLKKRDDYIIVMQHPVTTQLGATREHITRTLEAVSRLDIQVYWFWPNVDAGSDETSKGIRHFRETRDPQNIFFFKNLSPSDFLVLLKNAKAIVGNSSVAIREASYFGTPSINIGERQSGRERGHNVIDVEVDEAQISNAIDVALKRVDREQDTIYGDGLSGGRIAELLSTVHLKFDKKLQY